MNEPSGRSILETLIALLEEQENIKITAEFKKKSISCDVDERIDEDAIQR